MSLGLGFHPMDERERRARAIQSQIRKILYEDWAPLGFIEGLPTDEYDAYVGGVYRLLASGASCEQVAEHLAGVERSPFGYPEATAARKHGSGKEAVRTRRAPVTRGIT